MVDEATNHESYSIINRSLYDIIVFDKLAWHKLERWHHFDFPLSKFRDSNFSKISSSLKSDFHPYAAKTSAPYPFVQGMLCWAFFGCAKLAA